MTEQKHPRDMTDAEFRAYQDTLKEAAADDYAKAMGLPPRRPAGEPRWTPEQIAATEARRVAAEERKAAAAKMPDARELSDTDFEKELARQGIYLQRPMGS